jgi:ABC-type uncharacterized transport system permease subunit
MASILAAIVSLIPFLAVILMFLGVPCLILSIKALKKYLQS